VLHSRRVEGRSPAAVVVLRQLEVITLAVHAAANHANPAPRVQPRSDRGERVDIRAETRRFQRDEKQAAEVSVMVGGPGSSPCSYSRSRCRVNSQR
jgi:hypothetical protein